MLVAFVTIGYDFEPCINRLVKAKYQLKEMPHCSNTNVSIIASNYSKHFNKYLKCNLTDWLKLAVITCDETNTGNTVQVTQCPPN